MTPLHQRFFGPADAADIALFRFLYCLAMAVTVALAAPWYAYTHEHFLYTPTPLFSPFGNDPLPLPVFNGLAVALVASLVCASLGCGTRVALGCAAVLYFVYFGTQLGFTKPLTRPYVFHIKNLGCFVLLILAFAPGVTRFSLDSWFRHGRRWPEASGSARFASAWPKNLILVGVGAAYFGSGYCKMVKNPLWVDGHTAAANVLRGHLYEDTGLALFLGQFHIGSIVASVLIIILELTFIVGIFLPRIRWFYAAGGLALHLAIYLTMRINFFPYFAFSYLVLVEWRHIRPLAARLGIGRLAPDLAAPVPPPPAPGTVSTGPATRWLVAAFAIVAFIAPVFARVEAWPFSDYRVFTSRNHPLRIGALRIGGYDADGTFHWMSDAWIREVHRRHGRALFDALGAMDFERLEAVAREAADELPPDLRDRFRTFQVIHRRIRPGKVNRRWDVQESTVASFELEPSGPAPASVGAQPGAR